jgi:hypothetical protein
MMREKQSTELAVIREKRTLLERALIKLFPRTFNSIYSRHICRAKEKGEISSDTMHSLCHYFGADCRLRGYGEVGKWF